MLRESIILASVLVYNAGGVAAPTVLAYSWDFLDQVPAAAQTKGGLTPPINFGRPSYETAPLLVIESPRQVCYGSETQSSVTAFLHAAAAQPLFDSGCFTDFKVSAAAMDDFPHLTAASAPFYIPTVTVQSRRVAVFRSAVAPGSGDNGLTQAVALPPVRQQQPDRSGIISKSIVMHILSTLKWSSIGADPPGYVILRC